MLVLTQRNSPPEAGSRGAVAGRGGWGGLQGPVAGWLGHHPGGALQRDLVSLPPTPLSTPARPPWEPARSPGP